MMANGGEPYACGKPIASIFFFVMFHILVSQIFVNLFIAIIIDAFLGQTDHFNSETENQLDNLPYALFDFVELWSKYDEDATGYIDIADLENFIIDLCASDEGWSLVIFADRLKYVRKMRITFLCKLNIPTYDQMTKVNFTDTL